jgi:hypothetical protein
VFVWLCNRNGGPVYRICGRELVPKLATAIIDITITKDELLLSDEFDDGKNRVANPIVQGTW